MSRFDQLLRDKSRQLDRQLGETWYYTEGGGSFVSVRVLVETEVDPRGNPLVDVNTTDRTKTITVYKDPTTVVGGEAMGGIARPLLNRGQFVRSEEMGKPGSSTWILDRIVSEDLLTWTLQIVNRELGQFGRTADR